MDTFIEDQHLSAPARGMVAGVYTLVQERNPCPGSLVRCRLPAHCRHALSQASSPALRLSSPSFWRSPSAPAVDLIGGTITIDLACSMIFRTAITEPLRARRLSSRQGTRSRFTNLFRDAPSERKRL